MRKTSTHRTAIADRRQVISKRYPGIFGLSIGDICFKAKRGRLGGLAGGSFTRSHSCSAGAVPPGDGGKACGGGHRTCDGPPRGLLAVGWPPRAGRRPGSALTTGPRHGRAPAASARPGAEGARDPARTVLGAPPPSVAGPGSRLRRPRQAAAVRTGGRCACQRRGAPPDPGARITLPPAALPA